MQPCNYNYFFFLHASFHLITHNLFNRCLFLFLYIYMCVCVCVWRRRRKRSRLEGERKGRGIDGANPLLHIDGDDDLTLSALPGKCLGSVFGKLSLEITCFSSTWLLTRKRRRRRNSKIIIYYHLTGYWIFFIRFIFHCRCCNYQRQNNF